MKEAQPFWRDSAILPWFVFPFKSQGTDLVSSWNSLSFKGATPSKSSSMLFRFCRSLASVSGGVITFSFFRRGAKLTGRTVVPDIPLINRLLPLLSETNPKGCLWCPNWKCKLNSPNLDCNRTSGIHSMLKGQEVSPSVTVWLCPVNIWNLDKNWNTFTLNESKVTHTDHHVSLEF